MISNGEKIDLSEKKIKINPNSEKRTKPKYEGKQDLSEKKINQLQHQVHKSDFNGMTNDF